MFFIPLKEAGEAEILINFKTYGLSPMNAGEIVPLEDGRFWTAMYEEDSMELKGKILKN